MIEGRGGGDARLTKTFWLRRRVSVERRFFYFAAARPEAAADALVGVGLARDRVGIGSRRRGPARKARHRHIEAAPEKMHWARLANKTRPELFQHLVDRKQYPPEPADGFGVVRGMNVIFIEGNRLENLDGHPPDLHVNVGRMQQAHKFLVEIGDRARNQWQRAYATIARFHR